MREKDGEEQKRNDNEVEEEEKAEEKDEAFGGGCWGILGAPWKSSWVVSGASLAWPQ